MVVAVRDDGAELIFDETDVNGFPMGHIRNPDGSTSRIMYFDVWTKVGNWKPVDKVESNHG